jgi:hypothetical protein
MFDVEKLLGQMLSGGIGGGKRESDAARPASASRASARRNWV